MIKLVRINILYKLFDQVCNFEFGDNDYGIDNVVYESATVYYKDLQTTVRTTMTSRKCRRLYF
jgi:hypothetical protein